MESDKTQQQSLGGLQRSEQLSLRATVPPADIAGYNIETRLGQGAFGEVWLGQDLNTGRQVAIKFYLHRTGVNWSLLEREVKHLVNMSTGRYIVQVLGVGWDAEPPYYIMEYLENGSLEDMVRAEGALSIPESVRIFREVADGLSFAHGKGVLHCDLKPANIVLDHDWRPRLADFGQSRMSDEQAPSLGTLFYMAPEQADLAASPDAAWDVYALGAIAYTMLVGSPPYRTPEVVETLDTANSLPERLKRYRDTIARAPKPRLHYRRRGVDKGLCQIVDRCLSTQPRDRYQNVQQVIGAIDAWHRARSRRPLYLLGIVGPILVLVLMILFSARSISIAKDVALARFQQRSLDGNRLAAKFAAASLEAEIETLFRVVEGESRRSELKRLLQQTVAAEKQTIEKLSGETKQVALKQSFRDSSIRQELDDYLAERLRQRIAIGGEADDAAILNSFLVLHPSGINIGTAFSNPTDQTEGSPVGGNFAYRSYFTGDRSDAVDHDAAMRTPRPMHGTRLSASFRSTSTGKWKLGVSTPIWSDSDYLPENGQPNPGASPIGVFVLTINLGDFELLSDSTVDEKQSRFAALIDVREGSQRGTLLQHPLFQSWDSEALLGSVPQIDERQLQRLQQQSSDDVFDYVDPASEFEHSGAFAGTWVAAMQQVRLPRDPWADEKVRSSSDLWVLVQERTSSIEAPLTQLGRRMQLESYLELTTLLVVMLILWFVVFRLGQSQLTARVAANPAATLPEYRSTVDADR